MDMLLLQIAGFLKITFVDKLIPLEQAEKEAGELLDKIGERLGAE